MIPSNFITEWKQFAPWSDELQLEQDLIMSRALIEMFRDKEVASSLAFRGGTALYKLYLEPARYSEDIDLVQVRAEPIGPVLSRIRSVLDPWLGAPRRDFKKGRVKLFYRFMAERHPPIPLRLKIEINSLEHFTVQGYRQLSYSAHSTWFSGKADIPTYHLEKLLGTKLRALYQRKKARDLFDLWKALETMDVNLNQIIDSFTRYLAHDHKRVSRAEFEANLAHKMADEMFTQDITPLLAVGSRWDMKVAALIVQTKLLSKLPGDPWKGIEEKKTPGGRER